MAAPSWLATQPPTAICRAGLDFFSDFQRPSWWNTFSWAFSRMEQVLSSSRSAWSGLSTISASWVSRSMSSIRAESYSFIWQPWVLMKTLRERDGGLRREVAMMPLPDCLSLMVMMWVWSLKMASADCSSFVAGKEPLRYPCASRRIAVDCRLLRRTPSQNPGNVLAFGARRPHVAEYQRQEIA